MTNCHAITCRITNRHRLALAAAVLGAGGLLGGCAVSEKSHVAQHLSATVSPGSPDAELLLVFGNRDRELPTGAVAQVDR
jgi:hypothetical protein